MVDLLSRATREEGVEEHPWGGGAAAQRPLWESRERKGDAWLKGEPPPLLALLGEEGIFQGKGLGWYLRLEEAGSQISSCAAAGLFWRGWVMKSCSSGEKGGSGGF